MVLDNKEDLKVKKAEEIITSKHNLSLLAIKIMDVIISGIQENDDENQKYSFFVKDFKKLVGVKRNNIHSCVKTAIRELMQDPLEIHTDTGWFMCNWITGGKYIDEEGRIECSVYPDLRPYLLGVKKKYLQYSLSYVLKMSNKYAVRIYMLLKDIFNTQSRYGKVTEKELEVDYLRERLKIPNSYNYKMFEKRVIIKSKEELEKHTDIKFEFETIKKGRKITHIRFIIFLNEQIPEENTNILSKSENKKPKPTDFKNLKFKVFKQVLVDNYAGYYLGEYENKSITLSESGYIELNGKRVGADESFDVWEELFINRANLQPKSKEEFEEIKKAKEEEEKNNYLEKLRKEYRFRKIEVNVKNAFGNVNKIMYEVIDFLPPKNGEERCFDLVVKGEDGKTYKFDNVRYDIFVSYLV